MFQRAEYQHPQFEPLCTGSWQEVIFSWIIALTVVSALMAVM